MTVAKKESQLRSLATMQASGVDLESDPGEADTVLSDELNFPVTNLIFALQQQCTMAIMSVTGLT
jgi:hypothetical protein